jgi:hypothetical protein
VVVGFQYEQDARAMRAAIAERLAKFGLELPPEKTRVLRFRRHARPSWVYAHCGKLPQWRIPTAAPHLPEETRSEAIDAARGVATTKA